MPNYNFYQVGDSCYSNKFLAITESRKTGIPLKFNFFEEEFDQYDWTLNPRLSWDNLLDIRAQQIASLNKPIIVSFSGGTDSLTVYEVFKRNKIKIDALYIKTKDCEEEKSFYKNVLPFVEKERQEFGFKVIHVNENPDLLNVFYDTPDWWLKSAPQQLSFTVACGYMDLEKQEAFKNSGIGSDFVFVLGLEKPRIKIENNNFYSYFRDTIFANFCDPRFEYFFTSPKLPELHIKQCHMLVDYICFLANKHNKPYEYYNRMHDVTHTAYIPYAIKGCGRFGDLANSQLQKAMQINSKLYIPESGNDVEFQGRSQDAFRSGILHNELYVKNYIAGIQAMKHDSIIGELFVDPNNVYTLQDFESKHYVIKTVPPKSLV